MRNIACQNDECANAGAPYFDFEPDEAIVLCPLCGKAMSVTTLEQVEQAAAVKREAADAADAERAAVAEAEAVAVAVARPRPPSPLEELAALPPDRVVTVSDLLAILRPEELNPDGT